MLLNTLSVFNVPVCIWLTVFCCIIAIYFMRCATIRTRIKIGIAIFIVLLQLVSLLLAEHYPGDGRTAFANEFCEISHLLAFLLVIPLYIAAISLWVDRNRYMKILSLVFSVTGTVLFLGAFRFLIILMRD